MIEKEVKVLDLGFVKFVEAMGLDQGVIDAARVCYDSVGDPAKDRKLIGYLMDHEHLTPFEHCVFKFHVKAPLFVARQWFRHRSSSYNEASQRYTIVRDEFYYPAVWRKQDTVNKQGSVAGDLDHAHEDEELHATTAAAMDRYRGALDRGVAKELARMHLPTNAYTEWFWTVNARNLMAFIRLRSEHHAQWETRQYSNALWALFAPRMPWAAEAFLHTLNLSRYGAVDGIAGPSLGGIERAGV